MPAAQHDSDRPGPLGILEGFGERSVVAGAAAAAVAVEHDPHGVGLLEHDA
jgi:hypothetical protein